MKDRVYARGLFLLLAATCSLPAVPVAGQPRAQAISSPTSTPIAGDEPAPPVGERYRSERPDAGSGRRGLISVPGFGVWGGGLALSLLAAGTLWRLARRSGDTRRS